MILMYIYTRIHSFTVSEIILKLIPDIVYMSAIVDLLSLFHFAKRIKGM